MNYRSDIDGLRAIAVTTVVAFHFFPWIIPGGFVGVDVFFVISGFLITSIILNDVQNNKFSIIAFYKKRIIRIFPALFIVLSSSLLIGMFFLPNGAFAKIGLHVFGGSYFISNIILWNESGYFDTDSQLKPLLHLWSLGVEEQFYLAWPLVIMALPRKNNFIILFGFFAFAVSLVISVLTMHSTSGINYFSPATRAWEIMAGAILASCRDKVTIHRTWQNIASVVGMALLVSSFIWISKSSPFPGYIALAPVVGSVLIIMCGGSFVSRCLSSRWLIYIGKISFPLYLWHWPLYSFSILINGGELSTHQSILLVFISVVLSVFTYEIVEKNVSKFKESNSLPLILSSLVFFVGAVGLSIYKFDIKSLREVNPDIYEYTKISSPYEYFNLSNELRNGVCHSVSISIAKSNGCISNDRNQIFIWGDSYAASLYQGIKEEISKKNLSVKITQVTDGNGPPFFSDGLFTDSGKELSSANAEKFDLVSQIKPNIVIISWMVGGKNAQRNHLEAVKEIKSLTNKIVKESPLTNIFVIGPVPEWNVSLLHQVISYFNEYGVLPPSVTDYGLKQEPFDWDRLLKNSIESKNVHYISSIDALCNKSGCTIRAGDGPLGLVAVDWGHLSVSGSYLLMERISGIILDGVK